MRVDGPEAAQVAHYGAGAKAQRLRKRLTLDQVAELSGLSKGHISRFERGEKSLSIAALMRLSQALDTSVATLLGEQVDDDAIRLVRASSRKLRKAKGAAGSYEYARLTGKSSDIPIESFVVNFDGKSTMNRAAYHAGEEIFFVLGGEVELELADRTLRLSTGDYLQFSGSLRHRLRGVGAKSSVLVVIVGDDASG